MRAEYVNPFYQATQDVLKLMLDLDTIRGDLGVVEDMIAGREANVVIGVTGDLQGSILYSFPKEMVLNMVKRMSGMEMTALDNFVASALGEIANIISGNAVTYLSEQDYSCNIVPPQVIIGANSSISMATEKAILVPLSTSMGDFEINLSLKGESN